MKTTNQKKISSSDENLKRNQSINKSDYTIQEKIYFTSNKNN